MTQISALIKPAIILSLIAIVSIYSCKKENIVSDDPGLKLSFSSDSIIFDTVFTSVGSVTKQIRVYNKSNNSLKISKITLASGNQSAFRINIDGEAGDSFDNIELAGGDSLYIFARVTINPQDQSNPYVVEDDINFLTNGNSQTVKLVAWGQDANYIVADRHIDGLPPFKIVADSLETVRWTNEKPYIIYGYAVIDSYGKLIIEQGTNIYFHSGGGLWAYVDGVLNVLGTIDEPVTFQGDRLEEFYNNVPGQWDRIWLMEGRSGSDHIIENAVIKNGFIGIQAESFTRVTENAVRLHNVIVENMNGIGLFSRIFNIIATNTVIANCGAYNVAFTGGGYYRFAQSTIAGYWPHSVRNTPAVFINNFLLDSIGDPVAFPINFNMDNTILYGVNTDEFETEMDGGADSLYFLNSCIVRSGREFTDADYYTNVLVNEDPLFLDTEKNDYRIDSLSPAVGIADLAIAVEIPDDILGNSRLPEPDLGAYQFLPGQSNEDKGFSYYLNNNRRISKTELIKKGYYPYLK